MILHSISWLILKADLLYNLFFCLVTVCSRIYMFRDFLPKMFYLSSIYRKCVIRVFFTEVWEANFKIFATNIPLNGDLIIKSPFRGILVAKSLKFAAQTLWKRLYYVHWILISFNIVCTLYFALSVNRQCIVSEGFQKDKFTNPRFLWMET